MKKVIMLTFILIFFSLVFTSSTKAIELPDENTVKDFVEKTISNYNILINIYEKKDNNLDYFNQYKQYFDLYLEVGQTFQVECIKTNIRDTSTITLLFSRISGNDPVITVKYSKYLTDLIPHYTFVNQQVILDKIYDELPVEYKEVKFALISYFEPIINDTIEFAKDTADGVYEQNKEDIRSAMHDDELERINAVWEPFYNKYFNIIFPDDTLRNLSNRIMFNISGNQSYTYDKFETQFQELNQSLQNKINPLNAVIQDPLGYAILWTILISVLIGVGLYLDKIALPKYLEAPFDLLSPLVLYILHFNYAPTGYSTHAILPLIPILMSYYHFISKAMKRGKKMEEDKKIEKQKREEEVKKEASTLREMAQTAKVIHEKCKKRIEKEKQVCSDLNDILTTCEVKATALEYFTPYATNVDPFSWAQAQGSFNADVVQLETLRKMNSEMKDGKKELDERKATVASGNIAIHSSTVSVHNIFKNATPPGEYLQIVASIKDTTQEHIDDILFRLEHDFPGESAGEFRHIVDNWNGSQSHGKPGVINDLRNFIINRVWEQLDPHYREYAQAPWYKRYNGKDFKE